jgi:hypothetical protein
VNENISFLLLYLRRNTKLLFAKSPSQAPVQYQQSDAEQFKLLCTTHPPTLGFVLATMDTLAWAAIIKYNASSHLEVPMVGTHEHAN